MGIGDQGCREIKQGATADKARISYKHIPWSPISNRVGHAFSATRTNLRNRYLLIRHQSFPTLVSVGIMGALAVVRFRTAFTDPKDLVFLFAALVRSVPESAGRSHEHDALDAWSVIDTPVAVFSIDDTGALCWSAANDAQRAALCADFEALRGRRVEAFESSPLAHWVFEHREALVALTDRATFEPEHPDADTGRWTAHTVTPHRDADGAIRKLVITSADVTDRIRLAALVSHAARTDALGRVAGEAAHEFNNLMVAISGYAGLALRGLSPADRAHAQLVEVLRLSDEASSRSRQLMALARRHEGARSPLRLDALVTSLAKALQCVLREDVTVTVLGVKGNQVRIGVNAPRDVAVHREEIFERIKREEQDGVPGTHAPKNGNGHHDSYP